MKQLSVIVIGAGGRGMTYTDLMAKQPEKFKVVGVAEPVDSRRNYIKEKHCCQEDCCFTTWEDILNVPKFADIAIISTMDRMHYAPAMKALELGYDLLLEKPVAPTPEECADIYKQALKYNRKIMVCHVLRYTPYFMKMKKIITDGILGRIITLEHKECVGNVHQSHSFVRGNWGNSQESSCMLLQKCCHDLDILQWLLDKDCRRIHSFGSLTYFCEENAPQGSPERCTDGCPHADTCYYNAMKLYYDDKKNEWFRGAATKIVNASDEEVLEALRTTQYGKCVFKCNNDVVDHQIVNMEFEDSTTVSMTMSAFNHGGRFTHIMGTKGELKATAAAKDGHHFTFYDFATREERILDNDIALADDSILSGHGGGDGGIIQALYDYETDVLKSTEVSEIGISCANHMLVFAAEESRHNGQVISMNDFNAKYL